jgi:hypothetical protein
MSATSTGLKTGVNGKGRERKDNWAILVAAWSVALPKGPLRPILLPG